jgi:hypothetical protein
MYSADVLGIYGTVIYLYFYGSTALVDLGRFPGS